MTQQSRTSNNSWANWLLEYNLKTQRNLQSPNKLKVWQTSTLKARIWITSHTFRVITRPRSSQKWTRSRTKKSMDTPKTRRKVEQDICLASQRRIPRVGKSTTSRKSITKILTTSISTVSTWSLSLPKIMFDRCMVGQLVMETNQMERQRELVWSIILHLRVWRLAKLS